MTSKDPEAQREYLRRWREANPGYAREYREKNRDRINAGVRQRRQTDPEKFREQERRSYEKHREQRINAARQRYQADPERDNEQSRRWREANPDRVREHNRRWYAANRGRRQEYDRANRDRDNAAARARRQADPEKYREQARRTPGAARRAAIRATLWQEQGECCYLCELPLPLEKANVDHDHRCCPKGQWCSFCARGVTHRICNVLIGQLGDDPDHLELMVRNLRTKIAEVDERLAAKPQQLPLSP